MKNIALQFLMLLIFISSGKGQSNSYVNNVQRHIDKLFPSKFSVKNTSTEFGNSVRISEIGNNDIFFDMNGPLKNFTQKDLSYSYNLAKVSAKVGRALISQLSKKGISNIEVGADESTIKVIIHQDFMGTEIRKSVRAIVESINTFQENYPKKYHNFYISFRDSNSPEKGKDGLIECSYSAGMLDLNYEFCFSRIYDSKESLTENAVFNNLSFIPSGNQHNSLINHVFKDANIFLSRTVVPSIKGNNVLLGDEIKIDGDYKKLLLKILISPYSQPQTTAYIGYITCDFDIETKQTNNFILKMNKK
jgi:hypothetical protein